MNEKDLEKELDRLGKNPLKKRNYSPEALQLLRLRAQRNLDRYTPTSED